jgi:hypothetical protein
VFGAYPLGIAGGPEGVVSGPPDDIGRIGEALRGLGGAGPPLLVRMYVTFEGSVEAALDQVAQFAQIGSLVDLALSFHDHDGDVGRWCSFVEQVVRRHGSDVGSIGITNEADLLDVPFAPDGAYPRALEAMVDGVLAAAQAKASGFDPHVPSAAELAAQTAEMLNSYRAQLSAAGIPATVPIRVCESGWPTGPGRSEHDHAEVLRTIVSTVAGLRDELGITHWELFTLRDADSSRDDVFGQFGVLRDDYAPKAAYHMLCQLISSGG